MFLPPYTTGSMLMERWYWKRTMVLESGNGGTELETRCEMELDMKAKWKMEIEIKKRDEMAGKNGKVNEKSKWKNW